MEFIDETPTHAVVASEQPAIYDTKGRMVQPKRRKVWAKFERGIAPAYAQKVALETFSFRNIHEGIARERWFGYYNSEHAQEQLGWTDEERELIEKTLLERGYIRVEPVKLPAPWPAYDKLVAQGRRTIEMVAEKIAEKVVEDGYSVAAVIAYERENLDRPEVVAALEALSEAPAEEPELTAA